MLLRTLNWLRLLFWLTAVGCGMLLLALAPAARFDRDHEAVFRNAINQIEEMHSKSAPRQTAGDASSAK